ncbi:MAG: mechanosensitive ion channel family protein [Cyanobacteria bacterium J06635_15]
MAAIAACCLTLLLSPATYGSRDSSSRESPLLSQTSIFQQPIEELVPPDIQNFLIENAVAVKAAPVQFDGRILFQVADSSVSAEARSQDIERRLRDLAQQDYTAETLDVFWEPESESSQPVIYVNGDFLLTVTSADAQLEGLEDLTIRANELTSLLQSNLLRYKQERQPDMLWQNARYGIGILALTTLLSAGLTRLQYGLYQKRKYLKQQIEANTAQTQNAIDQTPINTALRQQMMQRQKRNLLEIQRGSLMLIQLGLWISSILGVLGLFPHTRWLQPVLVDGLKLPLRLTILALVIYALTRLGNMVVNRLCLALQNEAILTPERSQRVSLRLSTFSQVTKSIVASTLIALGILAGLALMGVNLASLLTGAGLIGLGISLAAQSLIKDIINGFLILFEDQYGVGDVIVVGDVAGFVETMNLRITQLRNEEGRLITIPNSQIAIVQNLSKEWSRVDLMVSVAPRADIDQAIALIRQVADDMAQETPWQHLILESPLILGVDRLDHYGATVRIWIKTLPLKQWDVAREYRRRLKIAFDQADIPIGAPQQFVQIQTTEPESSALNQHFSKSA